ncbi:hypothetical protein [Acidocella sp.]|uniref:hypothetical protein n=1 Tax=Acidocella sp. TaxID=50710 RepID=UPI003D063D1A
MESSAAKVKNTRRQTANIKSWPPDAVFQRLQCHAGKSLARFLLYIAGDNFALVQQSGKVSFQKMKRKIDSPVLMPYFRQKDQEKTK